MGEAEVVEQSKFSTMRRVLFREVLWILVSGTVIDFRKMGVEIIIWRDRFVCIPLEFLIFGTATESEIKGFKKNKIIVFFLQKENWP